MSFIERINNYKDSVTNRPKEKQTPVMLNTEYGYKIGVIAGYYGIPKARLIKILIDDQWANLSDDVREQESETNE